MDSEFIVERVLRATENAKKQQRRTLSKIYEWNFYTPPPFDRFRPSSDLFRTGFDLKPGSREVNRIWCRLYFRQTVGMHLARLHFDETYF